MNTPQPFTWPDLLEEYRCSDSSVAGAYDNTPPQFKAAIKTALALGFFYCRKRPCTASSSIRDTDYGFTVHACSKAAPWAFLLFGKTCGAAHMTTAAMLPVLASVPQIAACYAGKPDNAFYLAMELAGIEDIYQLPDASYAQLLSATINLLPAGGRLVFIDVPGEEKPDLADTGAILLRAWSRGYAIALPPALPDMELIKFCLGRLPETDTAPENAEIIYTGQNACQNLVPAYKNARLLLNKGCEGFWIFPTLGPKNFINARLDFSLTENL